MIDLISEYNNARFISEESLNKPFSDKIQAILNRGWAISTDIETGMGHNGVIITGLNPSYDNIPGTGKYNYSSAISNLETCDKTKGWHTKLQYWIRAKQVFGAPGELISNIGFIDLFPIRCTSQADFMIFDSEDSQGLLKSHLLKVTQQAIEELHPKVIIHANKTSGFYWGTVQINPWMGYVSESVLDSKYDISDGIRKLWSPEIDIRIITGINNTKNSIWQSPSQLVGSNTYLVIYKQLGFKYIKDPLKDRKVFKDLFEQLGIK